MCQNYEVSKITVRRAIYDLVRDGVLYTVRGKGTFVSQAPKARESKGTIRFVTANLANQWILEHALKMLAEQDLGNRVESMGAALSQNTREVVKRGLADVVVLREDELPGLMAEGALLDLTEFAGRDLDMEAYYPEPFPFCCKDSRLYAFPVVFSPVVMVYNRAHFREAGLDCPEDWDWETLLDYARRLTVRDERNGRVVRYGLFVTRSPNRWASFLLQNNGGVFDANGNFILDNARSIEALRFCRDMIVEHGVASLGAPSERMRAFVNGMASMQIESYYMHVLHAEVKFDWGLARLPRGRTRANLYVGTHLGIRRGCRNPELAWKVIQFFISPPVQRLFLAQRAGGPVLRSVAEEGGAYAWLPEHRDLFLEEMQVARPVYWGNDSTGMKTLVSEGLEMMWLGLEGVEEACAEIRRQVGLGERRIRY